MSHASPRFHAADRQPPRGARSGLTLLEVLIACGILLLGLSSIAAILPAASSRLGEASLEDRARVVAANAYAEVRNRGLLASGIFVDPTKPAVFGRVLPGVACPLIAPGSTATLIDPLRGFVLEDELIYATPTFAETPTNVFKNGDGPRDYLEAVCWAAMVVPEQFPAATGGRATLTIAVFRKDGQSMPGIGLTMDNGIYRMTETNEAVQKIFLRGCSFVLAEPTGRAGVPRWFRINSSWKDGASCFVSFADPGFVAFAGNNATVIGFEGLTRIDQYSVTLE